MNRNITIYLIYTGNFNDLTGGYIYNRRLVENLINLGVEVIPVQFAEKQNYTSSKDVDSADRIMAKIPDSSVLLIDSLVFGSNLILWKYYSHSHVLIPLIHLPAFLTPDNGLLNASLKDEELEVLSMSRHIVVTSPYSHSLLVNEGVPSGKIDVVLPGVDPIEKRQQYPELPEQLLCVSNLLSSKNQLMLLQALRRLKQFRWTLHLAGSPDTEPGYARLIENYIQENNLSEKVILHGSISGEKLQKLYLKSHLFLFPSILETYGMVVAEALNAGLPVFAYSCQGVKLSFSKYPILFFNDSESLYTLLLKVLTEKDYYRRLVKDIENIIPFRDWEMVAKLFMEIFKLNGLLR